MPDSITSIPCPALRPFRSDHEPFGVWALSAAGIPRKSTSINAGSEVRSDHTLGFRYSDQFRAGEGSECPKLWHHLAQFSVMSSIDSTASTLLFTVFLLHGIDCTHIWQLDVQVDCHLSCHSSATGRRSRQIADGAIFSC